MADRDTGLGVEIATMALDSLADTGLAELISQGYIGDAAGVVNDIAADGPDYERWVEVVPTEPGALSPEQLPGRLAAVLSAPDVGAAAFSWSLRRRYRQMIPRRCWSRNCFGLPCSPNIPTRPQ